MGIVIVSTLNSWEGQMPRKHPAWSLLNEALVECDSRLRWKMDDDGNEAVLCMPEACLQQILPEVKEMHLSWKLPK